MLLYVSSELSLEQLQHPINMICVVVITWSWRYEIIGHTARANNGKPSPTTQVLPSAEWLSKHERDDIIQG